MKKVLVAFLTLLAMLLIVEPGQSLDFEDELNQLDPCLNYVTGKSGDKPSSECCKGVQALKSATPTTDGRRVTCLFLKRLVATLPEIKDDKVSSIYKKCNVPEAFPISKNANCET
ncbi:unnamed protein product [Lupinus luteus]|uniref:Bifunctional inhibitor/plant lipid transfer protein/seed storage helical domain-containing protein n=1 Tax=Lupinus luteus TaxID=3873 RepID=A0AAV1X4T5_LUPLU